MSISIEISAGELVDKITILVIKLERMSDPVKLFNVQREYDMLMGVYRNAIDESDELIVLMDRLKEVNAKLWDIEGEIRELERTRILAKASSSSAGSFSGRMTPGGQPRGE